MMLDLHAHLGEDHRPADAAMVRLFATFPPPSARCVARALMIVAPMLRIPAELG